MRKLAPEDVLYWWCGKVSKLGVAFFAQAPTGIHQAKVNGHFFSAIILKPGVRHYCFESAADRDAFVTLYGPYGAKECEDPSPSHRKEAVIDSGKPHLQQPTPQQLEYAEQLSRRGYRRISNKYGLIARVDRADWLQFMAQQMKKSAAEFFKLDEPDTLGSMWADHYRRVYSQDKIELNPTELARLVTASVHDTTGFIDDDGTEKRTCGVVCILHGHFKHAVRCPVCIAPDLLLESLTPVMSDLRKLAKLDDRWAEVARGYDMLAQEMARSQPEDANVNFDTELAKRDMEIAKRAEK